MFVLAGYVAPAEDWAAFSDDWLATLNAAPAVRELKTRDAMRLQGCFHGWTKAERDKKLCDLYSVIDHHVSFELSAVIPMEPFRRIFINSPLPQKAKMPYFYALSAVISDIARHQISIGMTEKIDFVCDERLIEQQRILEVWPRVMETAPPDVKPMLGNTPIFKSDKEVLPLQAADLEVWWLRRRWQERLTGEPRMEYPWQPADIPGASCEFTEDKMCEIYEKVYQLHWDAGWRPADGDASPK